MNDFITVQAVAADLRVLGGFDTQVTISATAPTMEGAAPSARGGGGRGR